MLQVSIVIHNRESYVFKTLEMAKFNIKKTAIITSIVLVVIFVLVIVFISPIAKYLIEKYDVKYIGREVKTGIVYVNPFTGYVHIGNLRLFEQKSDSIFIKANGLSANFNWTKFIFKKTYEISSLTVNRPVFNITQQRKDFNFNDIIAKFTPKEKKLVKEARLKLNILDIDIINGRVNYRELVIPVIYSIKNINIESPGMWWDRDTMPVKFNMQNGPSTGDIKGNVTINLTKKKYRLYINIKNFDLQFMEQYIRDLAYYGSFRAKLDLDVHANGGFNSILETQAKGTVAINDFHFGKTPKEDFVSIDRLFISIKDFNPKEYKYDMDSILVIHPFFVYERYDSLDNLQRMFGKGGSKIKEAKADFGKFNPIFEIATQVQIIAANFLKSYYQVDRVAISNGDIKFNDFSIREKFSIGLNPLNLYANDLDKNNKRLKINLASTIKPYGSIQATMSIDPKNNKTIEATYAINKIPIPIANPYLISYTSFPLDRGSLDFNGYFNSNNGNISSNNHLVILDPRVGERLKKKGDTKWIPVPLIMAFVRERGNVIDYEIPVSGNLNNPKIHFKDIIFDLLKNIFVKPPTTAYAFKVNNIEQKIEKALTLKWEIRQTYLRNNQDKFIDKIADFLKKNKTASITVQPMEYTEKEKEYILFFEAKKKYYLMRYNKSASSFSEDDAKEVEKMSTKDNGFAVYLDKRFGNDIYTIQKKCMAYVGSDLVNSKYSQLIKNRDKAFRQQFIDNGTQGRIKILASKTEIPFNGFSYYKIKYNGEVPESLTDAYEKLDDIDEDKPRRKYKKERRKNKKIAGTP